MVLTAPKSEELTPLPHSSWPLLETPQTPFVVVKVNSFEPDATAVNVAGVWTDHVPEVRIPPFVPLDVRMLRVDFVGTAAGAL